MSTIETVAASAYDGAAEVGKIQSYIGLFMGGLISISLIASAIYLFVTSDDNLVDSIAVVDDASCVQQLIGDRMTQICNLKIKYTADGKEYVENIVATGDKKYYVNDKLDITYNSKRPSEVTTKQIRSSTIGIVLSIVGILICCCVMINFYMTNESKAYAAVQGTQAILGTVTSPFKN